MKRSSEQEQHRNSGSDLEVLAQLGVVRAAFLTAELLSLFLGGEPNTDTIYRWAREGKIPARNINGLVRFYVPEILDWSAKRAVVPQEKKASQSKFREVKSRLRSLTTEATAADPIPSKKGVG